MALFSSRMPGIIYFDQKTLKFNISHRNTQITQNNIMILIPLEDSLVVVSDGLWLLPKTQSDIELMVTKEKQRYAESGADALLISQ